MQPQIEVAGRVGDEIFDHARAVAGLDRRRSRGKPRTGCDGTSASACIGLVGRIAPHVLGDDRQAERLAGDRERRQIAFQRAAGPGTSANAGCSRQLAELVGREGVDRGLELDVLLELVCRRKPGEPCRRSPKRMVSVSPARR